MTLSGSRFTPSTPSIKVGDAVHGFNDALPHAAAPADRSWDSGNLGPGGSFDSRFDVAGKYAYVCVYHSRMTGSIVVSGE